MQGSESERETRNSNADVKYDIVLDEASIRRSTRKSAKLLIVCSKVKNSNSLPTVLHSNVNSIIYKCDSMSLTKTAEYIFQQAGNRKVEHLAFIPFVNSTDNVLCLSDINETVLTNESIKHNVDLRNFFTSIVTTLLDKDVSNSRFDFLGCNAENVDIDGLKKELKILLEVTVGISRDISGKDIIIRSSDDGGKQLTVSDLYFKSSGLKSWKSQPMLGFEKIRTVGKGAYGAAVLYRKKDDDSLVILKEINLLDLNAQERQLALNEAKVLSKLQHPHIISYYDSFEEDGRVIIEMEYADGGNLSQYLSKQEKPLEEKRVLAMFSEIVSAIHYVHKRNTLHRDLKTQNIFLTKELHCKVGDFGISKIMTTQKQANTVLGTPYYISPEMCEGRPYNEKSDIWALGCILYEMACLQRTFEGSNLPALVNKIMKGQFEPVKGNYSIEFKSLVMDMLQKDPDFRPTSLELYRKRIPELLSKFPVNNNTFIEESGQNLLMRKHRSVLYVCKMDALDIALIPISLPSKVKIQNIALGKNHIIVATVEHCIYSWGSNEDGQLGHGDSQKRLRPEIVDALKNKSIISVCAGESFSVFASDNGLIMTCGQGKNGCLGHKDQTSISKPRLVEELLSVDIVNIACGPSHVVAVERDGKVYSWGCGDNGRTGLGHEKVSLSPEIVKFSENVNVTIRSAYCGVDGTMLIGEMGAVYACGSNADNKLALNERQGFLMAMKNIFAKTDIDGTSLFTCVKTLARYCVKRISMGDNHTGVLVDGGHIITFGKNKDGQLGTGDVKVQKEPISVGYFESTHASIVKCGSSYTVAVTDRNEIVRWGKTHKSDTVDGLLQSFIIPPPLIRSTSQPITQSDETNKQQQQHQQQHQSSLNRSTSARERTDSQSSSSRDEIILKPKPILCIDQSGSHSPDGETVGLSNIFCHENNLFLQVETTAPPPQQQQQPFSATVTAIRRRKRRKNFLSRKLSMSFTDESSGSNLTRSITRKSASSRDGGDELSSSEMDLSGPIPTWLQKEVEKSAAEDDGKIFLLPNNAQSPNESGIEKSNSELNEISCEENAYIESISNKSIIKPRNQKIAPTPLKSKNGPNSTLSKIKRQKSKSKNSTEDASIALTPIASVEIDVIQSQLDKLRIDKEATEQRLRKVEEEASKVVASIQFDSEKKANEREKEFKQQIFLLENRLAEQNNQMQNALRDLKQELTTQEKNKNRQSRICSLQ